MQYLATPYAVRSRFDVRSNMIAKNPKGYPHPG